MQVKLDLKLYWLEKQKMCLTSLSRCKLIQTHLHIAVWPFCSSCKPIETITILKTSSLRFESYKWNILNCKKVSIISWLFKFTLSFVTKSNLKFVCHKDLPPLFFCFCSWRSEALQLSSLDVSGCKFAILLRKRAISASKTGYY